MSFLQFRLAKSKPLCYTAYIVHKYPPTEDCRMSQKLFAKAYFFGYYYFFGKK